MKRGVGGSNSSEDSSFEYQKKTKKKHKTLLSQFKKIPKRFTHGPMNEYVRKKIKSLISQVVDQKTLSEFKSLPWIDSLYSLFPSLNEYRFDKLDNEELTLLRTISIICQNTLKLQRYTHNLKPPINKLPDDSPHIKSETINQLLALRNGMFLQLPLEIKRKIELLTLFNNHIDKSNVYSESLTEDQQRVLTIQYQNDPDYEYRLEPNEEMDRKHEKEYCAKSYDVVSKLGVRAYLDNQDISVLPMWKKLALQQAHYRVIQSLEELNKEGKIPSFLNLEQRKKAIAAIANLPNANKNEVKEAVVNSIQDKKSFTV